MHLLKLAVATPVLLSWLAASSSGACSKNASDETVLLQLGSRTSRRESSKKPAVHGRVQPERTAAPPLSTPQRTTPPPLSTPPPKWPQAFYFDQRIYNSCKKYCGIYNTSGSFRPYENEKGWTSKCSGPGCIGADKACYASPHQIARTDIHQLIAGVSNATMAGSTSPLFWGKVFRVRAPIKAGFWMRAIFMLIAASWSAANRMPFFMDLDEVGYNTTKKYDAYYDPNAPGDRWEQYFKAPMPGFTKEEVYSSVSEDNIIEFVPSVAWWLYWKNSEHEGGQERVDPPTWASAISARSRRVAEVKAWLHPHDHITRLADSIWERHLNPPPDGSRASDVKEMVVHMGQNGSTVPVTSLPAGSTLTTTTAPANGTVKQTAANGSTVPATSPPAESTLTTTGPGQPAPNISALGKTITISLSEKAPPVVQEAAPAVVKFRTQTGNGSGVAGETQQGTGTITQTVIENAAGIIEHVTTKDNTTGPGSFSKTIIIGQPDTSVQPAPPSPQPLPQQPVQSPGTIEKPLLVLGVHLRGPNPGAITPKTTESVSPHVPLDAFWPLIDNYIAYHEPQAKVRIFFASDDQAYMDEAMKRYPLRAFSQSNVPRTGTNGTEPGIWATGYQPDAHRKGVTALVDTLLLSKCSFRLLQAGAVSEFSVYFRAQNMWSTYDLSMPDMPVPVWAKSPNSTRRAVTNITTNYSIIEQQDTAHANLMDQSDGETEAEAEAETDSLSDELTETSPRASRSLQPKAMAEAEPLDESVEREKEEEVSSTAMEEARAPGGKAISGQQSALPSQGNQGPHVVQNKGPVRQAEAKAEALGNALESLQFSRQPPASR